MTDLRKVLTFDLGLDLGSSVISRRLVQDQEFQEKLMLVK